MRQTVFNINTILKKTDTFHFMDGACHLVEFSLYM